MKQQVFDIIEVVEDSQKIGFIVMVGLPGSGKSTFRDLLLATVPQESIFVASTDDAIEVFAKVYKTTYDNAFSKIDLKSIEQSVIFDMRQAIAKGKHILVDRTNMSVKSRRKFLSHSRPDSFRVAIDFKVSPEIHEARLKARAELTGKSIPSHVMKSMLDSYAPPSSAEGFDLVLEVNNDEAIS